jgi:predicted ATPase
MLIVLGASLIATQGPTASEVEQTYARARHLCAHLEAPPQLFPVLRGLWNYYHVRAEYQTALTLGEQLLSLAQHVQDAAMLVAAHRAVGATLYNLGMTAEAHTHYTQGIALYNPQQYRPSVFLHGQDSGVLCRSYAAWSFWFLGYPDQGLAWNEEAVTLAQQSAHPFSLSFALCWAAVFHQCRREGRVAQERAAAAMHLTTEQGFPLWVAYSAILHGWALAHQGQAKEGIEQMSQGLSAFRATAVESNRSYFLALLAEAYWTTGEPHAGLTVLTEALTHVNTTGERGGTNQSCIA